MGNVLGRDQHSCRARPSCAPSGPVLGSDPTLVLILDLLLPSRLVSSIYRHHIKLLATQVLSKLIYNKPRLSYLSVIQVVQLIKCLMERQDGKDDNPCSIAWEGDTHGKRWEPTDTFSAADLLTLILLLR